MTEATDLAPGDGRDYGHARSGAGELEGNAVKFHALVCGADPRWDVPTITGDPFAMLARLRGGQPGEALADDVTHLLLVGRVESGPDLRRLATLLRAHTPALHVAVLESGQVPLAMAAVTAHVLRLGLEPGLAAREVRRLLEDETDSGLWVRRPGRVEGARPGLWTIVRSWFSRSGALARSTDPVQITRADAGGWGSVFHDSFSFLSCGELPAQQASLIEPLLTHSESWSRDLSPGARAIVGRQRAAEFAALKWTTPSPAGTDTPRCDSCAATTTGICAYCHAHWGHVATATDALTRPHLLEGTA